MDSKNSFEVFFIVSHLELMDTIIKYHIQKKNKKMKISDLSERFKIKMNNKEDVEFIVKIFSFSFNESKNNEKEEEIILNQNGTEFRGKIKFVPNKNNFIYDFSFDISHKNEYDIQPPEHLNLTKYQQLKIFINLFKDSHLHKDANLFNSLLKDSFYFLKGDKDYYYVDFYLSLLVNSYLTSNIIELLSYFNLNKIKLSEKVDEEKFSSTLNKIKISPDIITKYLNNDDADIEKNLEIFYTLLLYYRVNYEPNKVNELFEDRNMNKYYRKILFTNKDYFNKICLQNSFIDEMLETDFEMNYNNLLLILNYLKSFDKILVFLNQHSKTIEDMFEKQLNEKNQENEEEEQEQEEEEKSNENKDNIINLIKIIKIKEDDNIDIISSEMDKLLENENILIHLDIGQEFWIYYSEFFKKKNIDALIELKKIIKKIKEKNKKLITNSDFINAFIHETGLDMSINHKFKNNIELLKFIKDKDIYYTSREYKLGRNVQIFKGLNLSEKNEDKFIKIWNSINFKEMFDEEQYKDFQKTIISLIDNISEFHFVFKLFDYSNNKNFNTDIINELKYKYSSLIRTYNLEYYLKTNDNDHDNNNDTFNEDSIIMIYLLDKKKLAKSFIQDDFSKKLPVKIINEIYLELLSKFGDLSEEVIEEIMDFFSKIKDNLKCENLVYIMKKLNTPKLKKILLLKISKSMMIDKNMIFYEKERNELKVFIEFKKMNIFNDKEYNYSPYVQGMFGACSKILEYFKNNNISYNELDKIPEFSNLRNSLQQKIEILNIQKTLKDEEIKEIVDNLIEKKEQIRKQIILLDSYIYIDTTFFNISKHGEILELTNLLEKIKNGKIDEIIKNKNKFDEYKKMYPDDYIADKILLSTSSFFTGIFNHLVKKYKNVEGVQNIFEEAIIEFKTLSYLFERIPNENIKDEIFNVILKEVRKKSADIKKEIHIIEDYLKIKTNNPIKFEEIGESLQLYAKKNDMINIINGICLFLDRKSTKFTNYFNNLMDIKKNLSLININTKKIIEYLTELSKDNLNIMDNKDDNDYLYIFIDFYMKPDAFDFLLSLKEEDTRNFLEIVDISDNSFLNSSDIQDLEKCRKFLYDIKSEDNSQLTDRELIKLVIKRGQENKNISVYFNNYFKNYALIKDLKSQKLEKIETNKTKSKKIAKDSIFSLSINNDIDKDIDENLANNFIFFLGSYKSFNEEKEQTILKKISFTELSELRDMIMLNKNEENIKTKKKEDTIEYNKKFCENIKEIMNIYNLLEKIAKKGYHKKIHIIIIIKDNKSSYKMKNFLQNEDYEKCKNILNDIYLNMTNVQINAYKSNETQLIRLIYGRQFTFIINCLNQNKLKNTEPLLNYLLNNLYKTKIKEFTLNDKDNNKQDIINYNIVINNCNKYLTEVLKINNKSIKDIYKQNIIKSKYSFNGLYNYLSIEIGIEEQILSWYYLLTKNYPMAHTLLLCNKETSLDEIIAFMYRAILCPYNVLFMMGKIEELSSEKSQLLSELISELYTNKEKLMNSCLVFIYTDNNSEIVRHIQKIHYCEILKHEDKKKNIEEGIFEGEEVEIYYSDKAGVGKSTKIKNEAKEDGKNYVYFPLGGEFNKKDTIYRLKKITKLNEDQKVVIHIDLFDTEKTELMKEFLFSILITRFYGQNEDIFYLNKEVEIKIELPYGFIDFFSKFPFLKMFKNKIKISIENLPPLIVSKEIDSDIQILCNYLKLFKNKKIIDTDLYIPNISSDYFKKSEFKINAEIISDNECKELIYEYLNIDFPNYYQINNFIKILSGQFKKISLIKSLSANLLIKTGNNVGREDLKNNRYIIFESIIKNTRFFIASSFEKLLDSQNISYNNIISNLDGKYDEKKQNELAIKALSMQSDIISYNNIKSPLIFFYEGIHPYFTIISPYLPDKKEYQNLLDLENLHAILSDKKAKGSLKRYELFKPEEFYSELKQILALNNPINKNDTSPNPNNLNNIKDIVGYYVITADNFLKMLLILLRIRENVPVIMMGETGCGKTSLIRKLYELMNDGESNMKILNIHSGITNKDITDFLFKKNEINNTMSIIETAKELENIEEITQKEYLKKGIIYNKRKLWIFLDEINTCNCLGLISELLCKHSCNGIKLPDNIVFIAACNPYRLSKIEDFDGLKIRHDKKTVSNLVYTVNPLPHCLLNYVINFGSLSKEDERKYIENIIKEPIERYYLDVLENKNKEDSQSFFSYFKNLTSTLFFWNDNKKVIKRNYDINDLSLENKNECICLTEAANESVTCAQEFIRNKNDVSSVSLREIRRFSIFYEYFVKYLSKKKETEKDKKFSYLWLKKLFYEKLNDFEIYKYSVILSIFICYYFRIKKKEDRKEFTKMMDKIFKKKFNSNFLDIPMREEKYIINNITIPPGIAKNEALLNNLFVLFVCVTSKIPLFIVGKPGCSKSLSVQLLFKAMTGESSNSILFKTLPKLIINSYQGSLTSTSQGILKIFQKARGILRNMKKEELNKVISLIYLDEMGLAENSPNNPLKVLHSELEYDLNDGRNKISFVGISNWKLDASKMNRGIYLSIPDADEEDLRNTGVIIADSYNKHLTMNNKDLFLDLASTYYEYKEFLKTINDKQEFHGSRDFYHLIKIAAKTLFNKYPKGNVDKNIKENIAINSIERNLAGLKFDDHLKTTSLEKVKRIFQKKYNNCEVSKKYDVLEKIQDSINDLNNRYLLLITNSSIAEYLLRSLLYNKNDNNKYINEKEILPYRQNKTGNKDLIFYIGSTFIQDQNSEEYTLKMINKIQIQMEKNSILILKDLESVYPSLYDLFNQNFTVIGEKNYARLSVGYSNNTFSFVNDEFKCIVIVNEKDIMEEEAPFLNRFEKHIIDFEYLLSIKEIDLSDKILNIQKNIIDIKLLNGKRLNYDISKFFINFNKEEIQGIIYFLSKKGKRIEDIEDFIFEKISMVLPQDIILLMNYSENINKYKNEYEKIIKYYDKVKHTNLVKHLKNMEKNKNIIYTFSNILDPLFSNFEDSNRKNNDDNCLDTEMFGKLKKENIKILLVNSINCENELENIFDNFYDNKDEKLLVFKFNQDECLLMDYLFNFIEEKENNNKELKKTKAYIFIIYLKRVFNKIDNNNIIETITFLNDEYYQIFIDNLNGIDINITELMKLKENKDFIKYCLMDIDKILFKNIYSIFSYFRYTFKFQLENKNINKNNYSKYIVEYLTQNDYLKSKILNEILNLNLIKEDDIIKELFINNHINQNSIDYISIITEYLMNIILQYLTQFVFKSELKHILSPFLSHFNNKNKSFFKNKYISETIDNAFQEIRIDQDIKFINQIGCNYLTILLGLQIPGIKPTIDKIITFINDKQIGDLQISEDYFEKENEIRLTSYDEDNIRYMNEINSIKKQLKNKELNFYEFLKTIPLLKKVSLDFEQEKYNNKEATEYLNLFFNDYLLIFLSNNFDLSDTDVYNRELIFNFIKLVKYLTKVRFEDYDENKKADELLKNISRNILWIESNSKYIILILMIYQKLSFIQLLNDKMKKIIDNKEIIYEFGTKRSPTETKTVNECFYILMESMIKIILNENNLYNKIMKNYNNIYNFINIIKEIYHYASQIDYELSLFSKELSNLKSFIDIEEIFNELNLDDEENIKNLVELLIKKNILNKIKEDDFNNEEVESMINNIKSLYDFLYLKIGSHRNFPKLINNLFYGEIKRIKEDRYRKAIIEIILNNKEIINNSILIFIIVFRKILENNIECIECGDEEINTNDTYFELIEDTLNNNVESKIILEQVLLNLFESYFCIFFEYIKNMDDEELKINYKKYYDEKENDRPNDTFIMLDFSLKLLKNKLLKLESIFYNETQNDKINDYDIKNTNICKLYSIAYVKIYLYKAIQFILTKKQEFRYFEDEVIGTIIGESMNNFRKMIKIYIFKLIYNSLNSYQEFQSFHFSNYGFKFIEEFKEQLNDKNNEILNYYIFPKDQKFIKYEECLKEFETVIENKFICSTEIFEKYITEENIDIFYSFAANKILANKDLNDNLYSKFSHYAKNVINNCKKTSEIIKNLLFLLIDEHQFNKIIRPKILLNEKENLVSINYNIYEIVLNSMRFCLQIMFNKNNNKNLYCKLINENCTENINKLYLPGIDEPINRFITNYYLLEEHLNNKSSDYGAYVCSCGTYYDIPPCGFPIESYKCINCQQLIGGQDKRPEEKGYHKMIIRKGHYRIFKNENDKIKEFNRFKDIDELIPNMLLSDYKAKVIDPLLKIKYYGISKIDKITFIQKNKKIRNLSQVGYRLLNYILYSVLFFSDCLGFINNEFKEKYLYDNMTYIEIIKINWELLKEALFNKGITIIQIFLNLIFDKISHLLKNCNEITNEEQRNKFEDSVEKMLNESYKEYEEYSKEYLNLNSKLHNTNKDNLKSIILELYNPDEYSFYEYPFLKYFIATKYPTEEHFINEIYKISNYNNLYPLITSYINPNNDKIELLKYLPKYNQFVNFMVNKFSYKISRNEANKTKICDIDLYKNNENNFKENINEFLEIWNKIKKYCIQYKCHKMDEELLHDKMPLSNFLIDDGEIGKGMYLASGYERFIEWQNEFINPITKALDKNKKGILYYFNKNLKNKIDVQKASDNEIIKKDFPDNTIYINFLHLLSLNSYRNIYYKIDNNEARNKSNNETNINYFNYNNFIYDFDTIEEELGKILLTGKRLFNSENIKFVTYCYEGFRGEKSSTLIDFIESYPQKKLNEEEKIQLYDYIGNKNAYNTYDFTQLMFSMQLLIFYLTQEKKPIESKVNKIISEAPEYLNICDDCKNFFEHFYKFSIENIFEIFSFIELLCFDLICKNLKDDFKLDLDKQSEDKVNNYFKNGVQKIIEKKDLASACRKLISRYLISTRSENDISPENLLSLYLTKTDLWSIDIIKHDLFEMELNNIKDFNIKIGQVYKLCSLLDPDNILLKDINNKINEKKKKEKKGEKDNSNKTTKKIGKKKKLNF